MPIAPKLIELFQPFILIYFFRNLETFPFFWILTIILVMSMVSSVHYILVIYTDLTMTTLSEFFIARSSFPIMIILVCKIMLFKRLQFQLKSGTFTSATNGLKKAVFQAKLANAVALILLTSQIVVIIRCILLRVGIIF